jgi:pyruvate/2-oxoglutarate dehydrogenase complex dihydrolipoamide dehydrogenase (E3) component
VLCSSFYRAVPAAVFSQPPIGGVGLTEEQVNDLQHAESIEINDHLNILMNYLDHGFTNIVIICTGCRTRW